ncbi:MAG: tetratricopeptide repeat protein [Candidatus Binatia bacterium]
MPRPAPRAAAPSPGDRRLDACIAVALTLCTLAVFSPVVGHDFINYDDPEYVTANTWVRAGLTRTSVWWALTNAHSATWHPLTSLSHLLDVELFGLAASYHLAENVLLHALAAVLLFVALQRLSGARWPSALVAALFALHPQHVESVAWVSERKDVLSTVFWMLTLWAYAGYVATPRLGRYLLVIAAYIAGLLAKPMLVTMPFVLLLLDYWPLRRLDPAHPTRRVLLEKLPLLALAAVMSIITYRVQHMAGAVVSADVVPLDARLANAVVAYGTYLWKTVLPLHLAPFYPLHLPVPAWQTATAGLVLAAISAAVLASVRRRPYLLVGWGWYLGTLVPVLGLIKQGDQAMADRYTYVPLIGVFIMLAWSLADLVAARRWAARPVAAGAAVALGACAALTVGQLRHWRNSETLFRHALAVTTDNYVAHGSLGVALVGAGRYAEALPHFEAAVRIRPAYLKAQVNAGMVEAALGHPEAARAAYQRGLAIDPHSALAHYNLGVLLASEGRTAEAVVEYRAAVDSEPTYANAHNNLGLALAALGQLDGAIEHYRTAIGLRPDLAPALVNLAGALDAAGRPDEALGYYEAAVRAAAHEPLAHLNLGAALAARGRLDDAIAHYQEAVRLQPDFGDAQIALADALARRAGAPPPP